MIHPKTRCLIKENKKGTQFEAQWWRWKTRAKRHERKTKAWHKRRKQKQNKRGLPINERKTNQNEWAKFGQIIAKTRPRYDSIRMKNLQISQPATLTTSPTWIGQSPDAVYIIWIADELHATSLKRSTQYAHSWRSDVSLELQILRSFL